MTEFILLETFIILVSILVFQMGRRKNESNRSMVILTAGLFLVATISLFAYVYYSSPSGFIVKVYPNTQLDFCLENGHLIFDQASGIVPGYSFSNASGTGFYIEHLTINPGYRGFEFGESVSVTDLDGPRWAMGHILKPYRGQVTLVVENGPPGVNIAFTNSSVSAGLQDNSKAVGIPPFETKINLEIAPDAALTYGPHYIRIKGVGQDGETNACTCVLMVNQNCTNRMISI